MILSDYHIHTTFCDGKNTPREIVEKAIDMGLREIGFSVHSYTFFDTSYCILENRIDEYKREINALKKEYQEVIKIYCGVEQDLHSTMDTSGFDYVIGSLHYLKIGEEYLAIDEKKDDFIGVANEYFNGNFYALCDEYFNSFTRLFDSVNANIIGHFDVVSKFNQGYCLFDEQNERYINSWKKAVDVLLKKNIPFEINTGAIYRGYKLEPYPSEKIRRYITENGGKFILSSDSHTKNSLRFNFDKYLDENLITKLF